MDEEPANTYPQAEDQQEQSDGPVSDTDVQTQEDATYAGNAGPLAPADSGEEVQAAEASPAAAPADQLAIGSADASVAQARDQFAQLNAQMEANLAAVEKKKDDQDAAF